MFAKAVTMHIQQRDTSLPLIILITANLTFVNCSESEIPVYEQFLQEI